MSDGGKGSARRKEDAQAVLNNWNLIFGKKTDTLEPQQEEQNGIREDTPTMPQLRKQ
jgi:hypothetical protein